LKNYNNSLILFSLFFSLLITSIFAVLSYFYIDETLSFQKIREEHQIGCYANRITSTPKSVKELKNATFGTIESFLYKVAIFDKDLKLIYSTFDEIPEYDIAKKTYVKDDEIFYNDNKYFTDIGIARLVLKKNMNYAEIKNKIIILSISGVIFFLLCFSFLYFILTRMYTNINKKLDIFFRNAIHEIRTPLGVLQINLEFLETTIKDSMPLKRAQGGLNNLTSVYETIEYYIKQKKVKYPKEDINLSHFLEDRLNFFKVLADIKDIELKTCVEKSLFIKISRAELQRLIDNNLSNAIKYSKEQTKISVKLYTQKNKVILTFVNQGRLIDDTDKIFQRYYRGDDIKGGFGLGLDIIKKICNTYNILIEVKSENQKIRFTYKIPKITDKKIENE